VAERRSGIDLVRGEGVWAVVYGPELLGLYPAREEAIRRAREESGRILADRAAAHSALDPVTYPRLRSRRHPRHQEVAEPEPVGVGQGE
jgi:hypothetical protein